MRHSDHDCDRSLQLSPAGLAGAVLLLPGPLADDPIGEAMRDEVDELEAAGYVHEGVLAPWVARRLTLLLAPDLHVEAVVTDSAGTTGTRVWARVDAAIIGRIDLRGSVDLSPIDPRSIASTLCTVVGLAAGAGHPVVGHVPIDPGRLVPFEEALATGDHRKAYDLATDGGHHSGEELAIMAALASPERRTWRISARWTSSTGPEQRWLSALDAGRAGLWSSHGASDGRADHSPPLLATSPPDVWSQLIATLPPGTSGASSTSPARGTGPSGRAPCPQPSPPSPTASWRSSQPPMTSTRA